MDGTEMVRKAFRRSLLAAAVVLAPPGIRAEPSASEDHRRDLPENAQPNPALSTEGYPEIGRAQVHPGSPREVVGSSVIALLRNPIHSTTQVLGRGLERVSVRLRELTTPAGPARPFDRSGTTGDGPTDAPFGSPPMAASITLLPSSEAALRALLALVASAERQVDLMIYGWEDDPTGREVAAALEAAATRGVTVRLLVDRGGFLFHNKGAAQGFETFLDRLRVVPNVTVIEPPDPFLRFDHRKLAVIDGRTAWTGGMLLTEVARRRWENLAFLAEGPVAEQFAALFEDRWPKSAGPPGRRSGAGPWNGSPDPNAVVRVIGTDVGDRSLKNAVYHAVDHARDRIVLENPYFSDTVLAAKLVAAQRRGVDVPAVLTVRGNIKRLNQYVVLTANRLVGGGVRMFLAPSMTHLKAMTIDGHWSYIGTGNFDELSLRNNREVSLAVESSEIALALEATLFRPDIARRRGIARRLPLPKNWPVLELFSLWY